MTPEDLDRELAAGRLRTAYLLAGEEPLLRDDALALLRAAALGDADPTFDLDRLDGRTTTAEALALTLRTLPVVAPRRLVVLIEPEAGRGASRGLGDAIAALIPELGDAGPTSFVAVAARPDRRSRWVKAFGDAVVSCDAPRRTRQVADFVRAEAERQGVRLERGVAEALAERIGPQLLLLRQEIAKLALLAGLGEPLSRAHVAGGTILQAEESIWDLTDAIGEGRASEALHLTARLLAAGSPPPVVLGALVAHFRRLLRLASGGAVAGPPFLRSKLASQAQRYGAVRLRAALGAIHETDLALKGAGTLRPELALERLVIALAG